MNDGGVLIYSPLLEEDKTVDSWDKLTIDYIYKNKSEVYKIINGIVRRTRKRPLQEVDIDDIFSEIVIYLYKSDDYNINKAIDNSKNGTIVSLEGYVNSCIGYCVMRYLSKMYNKNKNVINDSYINMGDSGNVSMFDYIPDNTYDEEVEDRWLDLEQQCKIHEHSRYKYGHDIFLIMYVRLLTLSKGLNGKYNEILNILGINRKELSNIEEEALRDSEGIVTDITKAITNIEIDDAILVLEKYVHSAKNIKNVICGQN